MARQIVVEIVGDSTKFTKSIDQATGSTTSFSGKLQDMKSGILDKINPSMLLVAGGFAAVGAGAVAVGSKVFEMGMELEGIKNKAAVVFGDSLPKITKAAEENATQMGLTKNQYLSAASAIQDLLIPMGFQRDEATGMTSDLMNLSGALSAWSGGQKSAEEVSDTITKAMLGERDGLKSLGISISEADVQTRLLEKGQQGLTGAALEQAKAQATLELITEKSTDAQKAYADGSNKGMLASNKLNATFGNLIDTLVEAFYPIALTVAEFLADVLPPAIQMAKDGFKAIQPALSFVANIFGTIVGVVQGLWNALKPLHGAILFLVSPFEKIALIVRVVSGLFSTFQTVASNVGRTVGNIWNGIVNAIKRVINTIIRGWNSLHFKVPSVDLGPLGKIGGFTIGVPKIPYLHAGGIVPGMPGSDVLSVLQAGEVVVPRKYAAQGAGGVTIVINGDVYGDAMDELSRKIANRLRTVA